MNLKKNGGILFMYHLPFRTRKAATTEDHINAFLNHSEYNVYGMNTEFGLSKKIAQIEFKVVILHYSIFGGSIYFLDSELLSYLSTIGSYKIAIVQDEYRFCSKRFNFMNDYNIDAVFTCYEPEYYKDTYLKFTNVKELRTYIPGHISDEMIKAGKEFSKPVDQRSIDIGYRGRDLPFSVGRGGLEKYFIGKEFIERGKNSKLKLDIGITENDRIYGDDWYRFVANCKASIGVESGVSITDLDGEVQKKYDELLIENPDISFEETYDRLLKHWEENIPYRTISPRHFEGAVFRSCLILFKGFYSGILKPMIHYIPLEKDFSNFEEVIALYKDEKFREKLTQQAYLDIVESENYTYRAFLKEFDEFLKSVHIDKENTGPSSSIKSTLLFHHKYSFVKKLLSMNLDNLIAALRRNFPGREKLRPFVRKYLPFLMQKK